MLFKDEVRISVTAGKGGDGAATFMRAKYIPRGGPDGGDGGDGGSVVLRVNTHLRTLSHIHNNQKFKAEPGQNGMGNKMYGRRGHDTAVDVPAGTLVLDAETKEPLADLTEQGQEWISAKGGRGGRGNVWFKSSTNQTPFYAENGKPGQQRELLLELKMIAHVGLVGYPNAGKSTLVSRITSARPKIGNYPFTTLKPNIGVMKVDDSFQTLLIADIPGLIEGAHEGKGLGIDFLKHIERTRIILYVLDAYDSPMEKFIVLRKELASYSRVLSERPFLIAMNKTDMLFEEADRAALEKEFAPYRERMLFVSALNGSGLVDLKRVLYKAYLENEHEDTHETDDSGRPDA